MAETYSAGIVTAYGAAVRGGYTGTYEQFCAEQAQFGVNAAKVAQDRAAVEAATETFTTETVPGAVQAVQQTGATQVQAVEAASETEQQQIALAGAAQETRVTQAGDDQVDAVEEAGATQVGNVNTAGTTQVGAVNTAGATQVQAVEDKGQEVIGSIPSDYTDLTEDVADLKSAFEEIAVDATTVIPVTATAYSGFYINGTTTSELHRFGTGGASLIVYTIPVEAGKSYHLEATNLRTVADEYGFVAYSVNAPAVNGDLTVLVNGSTTKVSTLSYDFVATANGYLNVVKGFELDMTYAFTEIRVDYRVITDKTLSVADMPADAKAVGDRFDLLGYSTETEKSDVIAAKYTVVDRYIQAAGKIAAAGSNNFPVSWFPVTAGCSYTITGSARAGGSGQAIVCFDNTYDSTVGHICKEVIELGSTTETEYNISYTPAEDGYIVMPTYSSIKLVVTLVSATDFQRIYEIEKSIEEIEAEIDKTKMPVKIQLFGDSITDNLWGDQQTWADFIQQNLPDYNVTVVNDAVGGAGIGHGSSKGTTPSHQTEDYNHVYDLVTDGVTLQTDANYIVILAGTNNWASGTDLGTMESSGPSTVYGALKGVLEYISTHSAATVFVCTIPQRYNTTDQSRETNANGEPLNPDSVSLADYCEAFRKVSAFYGMPCIHLNEDLGWNRLNISYFCGDGLHPNAKGDKMLAAFICAEIEKHIGKVSYT